MEIKKGANPGKEAIKNFNVVEKFELKSPNGVVICLSKEIHALNEKIILYLLNIYSLK